MFNNRKITHSDTEEMHNHQPEDLNLVLEKFYAELRKVNGTDYEQACLRVMMSSLLLKIMSLFFILFLNKLGRPDYFSSAFTFFNKHI